MSVIIKLHCSEFFFTTTTIEKFQRILSLCTLSDNAYHILSFFILIPLSKIYSMYKQSVRAMVLIQSAKRQ